MTAHHDHHPVVRPPGSVPQPSALAPDASVGEILAEIDRNRHDAAKTVAALADRFTIKSQATRRVRSRLQALRWDSGRVAQDMRAARTEATEAIPPGYADLARKAAELVRGLPRWATIGVPATLVLLLVLRSKRHN
jgi:hypothetical protein